MRGFEFVICVNPQRKGDRAQAQDAGNKGCNAFHLPVRTPAHRPNPTAQTHCVPWGIRARISALCTAMPDLGCQLSGACPHLRHVQKRDEPKPICNTRRESALGLLQGASRLFPASRRRAMVEAGVCTFPWLMRPNQEWRAPRAMPAPQPAMRPYAARRSGPCQSARNCAAQSGRENQADTHSWFPGQAPCTRH